MERIGALLVCCFPSSCSGPSNTANLCGQVCRQKSRGIAGHRREYVVGRRMDPRLGTQLQGHTAIKYHCNGTKTLVSSYLRSCCVHPLHSVSSFLLSNFSSTVPFTLLPLCLLPSCSSPDQHPWPPPSLFSPGTPGSTTLTSSPRRTTYGSHACPRWTPASSKASAPSTIRQLVMVRRGSLPVVCLLWYVEAA